MNSHFSLKLLRWSFQRCACQTSLCFSGRTNREMFILQLRPYILDFMNYSGKRTTKNLGGSDEGGLKKYLRFPLRCLIMRKPIHVNLLQATRPVLTCFICCVMAWGQHLSAMQQEMPLPWSQFRGPLRDGSSHTQRDTLTPSGPQIVWLTRIGTGGYSGISAAGDLIYTLFSDSQYDYAVALYAATGKEAWRYLLDETYKGHSGSKDGPHSTPTIDGDTLYVLTPHGKLYALTKDDGQLVWGLDIKEALGAIEPFYGFATSPLIHGTELILQVSGTPGQTLVALDKKTGEKIWGIRLEKSEYTSPVVATLAGVEQILLRTEQHLFAVSPIDGKTLWQVSADKESTSSPVVVSPNTVMLAGWQETVYLEIVKRGSTLTAREVWRNRHIKKNLISPVFHAGYFYGFSGSFMVCIEAASGKKIWRARQGDNASAISVGDYLVVISESGRVVIVDATPKAYTEISSLNVLHNATVSPPATHQGNIYVRGLNEIACLNVFNPKTGGTGQ